MPGAILYTWGAIPFEVYPLSLDEVQHVTETDWARKDIAGAAVYREWVGENDEELHFRGKVFPHFFAYRARGRGTIDHMSWRTGHGWGNPGVDPGGSSGGTSGGLGHLDVMDNMRRLGQAHALTRGDGWHLGWFVIQRLMRAHQHLEHDGIGQMISFEVTFQRVPVTTDPKAYYGSMWGAIS